ncbi:hypothetical protein OYC64_013895 [Pagothenia borchgrevinki]|uniref:Uncharacterized protein n=1 Tax=Pagothenia borchgrevinki TaxID=8213 RepID=A0ABD2FWC2_PAGBO
MKTVASGVSEELTDCKDIHLTSMKTVASGVYEELTRVKRGPPPHHRLPMLLKNLWMFSALGKYSRLSSLWDV